MELGGFSQLLDQFLAGAAGCSPILSSLPLVFLPLAMAGPARRTHAPSQLTPPALQEAILWHIDFPQDNACGMPLLCHNANGVRVCDLQQ